MKLIPNSVSRFGYRTALKVSAKSPTILVVTGVVGLGVTAVMAARATREIDPILDHHHKQRLIIEETAYVTSRAEQKALLRLYTDSAIELTKLYGTTIVVGTVSAGSILYGHKVLHGRHMATMAAYSGLMDQFKSYRGRVARTLGVKAEQDIYNGAHGEWTEDPDHKGEYKLEPKYDRDAQDETYLRPMFDHNCPNWTSDPVVNYAYLRGVQNHMNNVLEIRGHVFLNDVFDALRLERTKEGQAAGWLRDDKGGVDGFIDFGFMTGQDPQTVAFRENVTPDVRLNFNIDGLIWNEI